MRAATYKEDVASDRRRRKNVLVHILNLKARAEEEFGCMCRDFWVEHRLSRLICRMMKSGRGEVAKTFCLAHENAVGRRGCLKL